MVLRFGGNLQLGLAVYIELLETTDWMFHQSWLSSFLTCYQKKITISTLLTTHSLGINWFLFVLNIHLCIHKRFFVSITVFSWNKELKVSIDIKEKQRKEPERSKILLFQNWIFVWLISFSRNKMNFFHLLRSSSASGWWILLAEEKILKEKSKVCVSLSKKSLIFGDAA